MALTKGQIEFLEALANNFGVVSKAARALDISRQQHWIWMNKSANKDEYRKAFDDVLEERKDFIEDCIIQRIIEGDADSILIHLAKTLLRDRGFGEKIEVDHSNSPVPINLNVEITNDVRGDKNKG